MSVVERPFSDFLRNPNEVVARLSEGDVVLRRRNAPALRLSRADRDEDMVEVFETLARLLRRFAVLNPSALEDVVVEVFPWVVFLPESDRGLFVSELTSVLLGSASVKKFGSVSQVINEWMATAEIYADPELLSRFQSSAHVDAGVVKRPVG